MTVIKILLIVAVIGLVLLLLRSHGTNRGGAYVKIGMAIFLVFAAYAVVRPDDVTWVATRLGVGRGADLVLYILVVGFGFFAISTYLRFKELELKYARLARAVALNEAARRDDQERAGRADGVAAATPGPHRPAGPGRPPESAPARPTEGLDGRSDPGDQVERRRPADLPGGA